MENDTIFFCERFLSELYRLPITYQQITVASDFVQSPQDTDKIDAKNITTSSELKKVNIFSIRYLNWKRFGVLRFSCRKHPIDTSCNKKTEQLSIIFFFGIDW